MRATILAKDKFGTQAALDDAQAAEVKAHSLLPAHAFLPPIRAHAREARAAGAAALKGCTRCSASGRCASARLASRPEIMNLVGLDQPEPDKPRDSVALHFDEKPKRLVRGRGTAPPSVR